MEKNSAEHSILVGEENISLIHRVTGGVITAKILGREDRDGEAVYWLDGLLSRQALSGETDGMSWCLTGAISSICTLRPVKKEDQDLAA